MKAAERVVGTEEDKKEAIKRMIEGDKYNLMVNSLMRPQGLFEIYESTAIGKHLSSIAERLESVSKIHKHLVEGYGLAMEYGIHQDTVRLRLIATQMNEYPLTHTQQGMVKVLRAPQMLENLAGFSYSHETTIFHGIQIGIGKDVGPLEHEIFQELKAKDQQFENARAGIGRYMIALGTFAQELTERRLSID